MPYVRDLSMTRQERWTVEVNHPARALHDEIIFAGGYWSEIQLDHRMALVCVRTTAAHHRALRRLYKTVTTPARAWTPTRAKVPGSTVRVRTKTLARVEAECFSTRELNARKRLCDHYLMRVEKEGYVRLPARMSQTVKTYLLRRAAWQGYGLNRLSPGTFPTTGELDNFTRANEGPPPSASWGGQFRAGTGLSVISNVCSQPSADGTSYWGTSFAADQEVYATIAATTGQYCIFYTRLKDVGVGGTEDGYAYNFNASADTITIDRVDNDSLTALTGSTALSHGLDTGNSMGGEDIGSTHTSYSKVADVWYTEVSVSDSTYTAGGFNGMRLQNTNITISSYGGGTIVSYVAPVSLQRQGGAMIGRRYV